ncbi:interleukin-1 receptor accessory protein isoform X2 [Siniperca chuatsi]|uniref:interleukin-1 receptor accessory protein isoform X2 n=1 Tax=Siniperca chuatsi TaxID=119488 RepID=UPI001CE0BEA4|nr:interleukin-1 receptor accessory protein isoform X2 [Siniperca chuatsi]
MASFISTLLFLFIVVVGNTPTVSQSSDPSEPMCYDWGESSDGAVSVLEGEAGWLSCPLFSHPSVYNYTSTQSTGHNLFWYRLPEGHDLEQPITYSNKSSCSKIAMRLKVLRPDEVVRSSDCEPPVAVATSQVVIPVQEGKMLDCPDLQDAAKMADGKLTVTWYHLCAEYPFWNSDRQQKGVSLQFHVMLDPYKGLYFCIVHYQRKGKTLNFTRSINVTAVYPSSLPKVPSILHPAKDQVFTVKQDSEVRLVCKGLFPYLDSWWDIWWTVDGKTLDKLADHHRFSKTNRRLNVDYGDRTEESVLVIQDFQSTDLNREYNCSVKNERGFETRRAQLEEEVSLPSVELGCGLGVTLVLMLLLFVVYHVFWLELLLLYRSWFGTDERHTDDKEYDVYISYARNSEEEQFVLSTLRRVLENELGYSVCIFDRDSLPGGTITDETLSFVARSRRLLVVVSPGYASQGSQALLELKAGIDGMALGGHLRVILVQYKPVQRQGWVRELRRARVALSLVRWQGDKSRELTSRFWKRLRVELPVRRISCREEEESNLSETILRSMQRSRRLLFVLSPDFLAEKSFSLLECRLGLYLQHGHQASVVAVVYRSVSKLPCVEVAQLRQAAATTVTWRGGRSEPRRSRFWLRLRLALPVRPLAMGRRLIDSTSSHSDLAALALQRAQRIQKQNQRDGANQSRRSRRASANQSRGDRQAPPTGRGRVKRGEGSQHSRSCSGCAGLIGQVEDKGAELTVETEMQQVSHDRTEIQPDPVPETEPTLIPDSVHDTHSTPNPAPVPDPASDPDSGSALPTCEQDDDGAKRKQQQQQQMIGSKLCQQ